ncbi:MAG: hypothetical protein NTX21_03445 [Alphaproteobacteria bacterium]|nr:hypothetical protein [Alphaproteobacteria bacterium]
MRTFEISAGLLVALILFLALKVIGMVIKLALFAAVLGFVAGLLLAHSFRRPGSGTIGPRRR